MVRLVCLEVLVGGRCGEEAQLLPASGAGMGVERCDEEKWEEKEE